MDRIPPIRPVRTWATLSRLLDEALDLAPAGFGLMLASAPVRYRHYQMQEWRHGDLRLPGYERASGIAEESLGAKQLEGGDGRGPADYRHRVVQ
jgi:hypothetical protein